MVFVENVGSSPSRTNIAVWSNITLDYVTWKWSLSFLLRSVLKRRCVFLL